MPDCEHGKDVTRRDPATGDTARDDHLVPEICPKYVRNMPGICLMMPDDVSLPGLSGDRVTG